jgi:hypothetical protein
MKELDTTVPAGKKITNYAFSEDAAVIEPNVHIVGVPLSDEELNAVLQPKK